MMNDDWDNEDATTTTTTTLTRDWYHLSLRFPEGRASKIHRFYSPHSTGAPGIHPYTLENEHVEPQKMGLIGFK